MRIWDATTGALVRELRQARADGKRSRYYLAAISPDGRAVAAIALDGAIAHVWDTATGALFAELRSDGSNAPSLAFSVDGRWLAVGGGDDVRVFDTRSWSRVAVIGGPGIRSLSWDPTSPRLVTGTVGGDATIWEAPGGAPIRQLRGGGDPPDGAMVLAGGADGYLRFWEVASARMIWALPAHRSYVVGVHFQGNDLVTRGFSGDVARWSLPTPAAVIDACGSASEESAGDGQPCVIVPR